MAHANVLELETCLDECLAYCGANPAQEFVKFYEPRLEHAKQRWYDSVEVSDAHYLAWQREFRADRVAWKKLGTELAKTQNELRKVNAVGYPDETVRHWDEEILASYVREMIDYLEQRRDVIDLAAERIEALTRVLAAAQGETSDADNALDSYKRHVLFRAEAMGTLVATIGDFRVAMRRTLGKRDEAYKGIRWPMSVMPDEPVL